MATNMFASCVKCPMILRALLKQLDLREIPLDSSAAQLSLLTKFNIWWN